jgi:hypothetical protein
MNPDTPKLLHTASRARHAAPIMSQLSKALMALAME